jgi:AcrR family transcriptional regulator
LRADAARNRQALLDAAERLFTERGLAVTLDDIADAAGVNIATAYRHFRNKHEVADSILRERIAAALLIAEDAAAAADPWQGLEQFLVRMFALMQQDRAISDLYSQAVLSEQVEALQAQMMPPLQALVRRAHRAGVVRAGLRAQDLGVVLRMLETLTDLPASDGTDLAQRYVPLMLAALGPDAPALVGVPPTDEQLRGAVTRQSGR